ncbi:MAG: hypothetical protein HOQ11_17465 [Gemmatimonadaceae bacterium]|nr:hypothetical protein [Gemmatimonadaceae bacterium]NUQ91621.1 hypothetical protein [Gemmatimonadaceae bacterium]NUR18112.1 hypothetical protein [Gemmatimonadaceae bacterium]NUS99194.1 hypothetical protein [Gemmatimonadaceae bacterium]
MKRALAFAAALAVLIGARGSILPSTAPVWLRGASPFGCAATLFPDDSISPRMLVLRPVNSIGRILGKARDGASETVHLFACDARPTQATEYGVIGIESLDQGASP